MTKPQFLANLATFTEEILDGKLFVQYNDQQQLPTVNYQS